jgi:hypothetical protein
MLSAQVFYYVVFLGNGARIRIRTGDLILTKDVLYLLSYAGTGCTLERETGLEPATLSLEG